MWAPPSQRLKWLSVKDRVVALSPAGGSESSTEVVIVGCDQKTPADTSALLQAHSNLHVRVAPCTHLLGCLIVTQQLR